MRVSPDLLPLLLAAAAALLPPLPGPQHQVARPAARALPARAEIGPFEVVRVVDADTLHVARGGRTEKLRLLSVDTEERLSGTGFDPGKPETVFGEECALWAQELFASLAAPGRRAQVKLVLPEGREQRDLYGRLLCYVLLPDGRNFNLLLVAQGKSPYFNKYGDSQLFHRELVAAQARARKEELGIWNPATNRARTAGAPEARRDYARLLPWWEARAEAIRSYRLRSREDPAGHVAADEAEELARAAAGDGPVHVFGAVERLFQERDGSRTVLLAANEKEKAVRARIPAERRAAFAPLELEKLSRSYHQNYVWIHGTLRATERGFELLAPEPESWRVAGPQPAR